ncbi:protein FAM111A-like [Oreochromis niloticus]|uniref:Serine protease n=1 Tax=Oreochromis niloticus TaxID=8128 RepID=A0A669BA41_ORENI|nr:protein FAM111A-like [Oreochromis niloticus]
MMASRNEVPRDTFEEEEPHLTHSFDWSYMNNKSKYTCNQVQTIKDCLKKSPKFCKAAEKQEDKELVIVRNGKVIASHFPCSIIKDECLILKFVKAVENPQEPVSGSGCPYTSGRSSKLVIFHVLTRGGKNVVKILKNPVLKKEMQELTVYAYKNETVEQALRRDGRFLSTVFSKNCVLSNTSTEVEIEMCILVDDIDGETFKIKLLDNSNPPESQPGSLDDAYVLQSESQASDSGGNDELSQQTNPVKSETDNTVEKKTDLCGNMAPGNQLPDFKKLHVDLSAQFNILVKGEKGQVPKLSHIQNLFRLEFGSSAERCQDVKTMKKLMELSNSVCQVRINGKPRGSGFLLFGNFVLTNAHVIRDFCNDNGGLKEKVAVTFSFESLEEKDGLIDVEEVVGIEYIPEVSGTDWALLKLSTDQNLPDGLLKHSAFVRHSGGICIIGYPGESVKKIDVCLVVSQNDRRQVAERHWRDNQDCVQLLTDRFFERASDYVEQRKHLLTYESCLYEGSSGSPVFNEDGNVVAMHTGGYLYNDAKGQNQSVIEYGYPFINIIERIIIQMVERKKFDVLKECLACKCDRQQDFLVGVKNHFESRNLTKFKDEKVDESLKTFFEFLSSPEPMDFD